MTRSGFQSAEGKAESWWKAIVTLTAAATSQAPISGGEFSGWWLLCGGD
jgi:hypothetical protein